MMGKYWRAFTAQVAEFMRARRGNVAMIFALSLIPLTVAAGAGLDLSRALMERARLAEALDAAGLAVGASQNLSTDQIQQLATAYFNANYTIDPSFGARPQLLVTPGDGNVTLSATVAMPTTLMHVVGINTLSVGYSSKIVWGQTKLWVALVLDNTGSMCQPYKSDGPCTDVPKNKQTKIGALKTATDNLLTLLKGASAHDGDVLVSIVPFTKDVNVGTSHASDSWINWSDWESAPANGAPSSSVGPGSSCPYSTRDEGYVCQSTPVNGSSSVSTIPSSGTYAGYVCPGVDNGSDNSGRANRYYNGCYNSQPKNTKTVSSCNNKDNCTCTSGRNSVCTQVTSWSHSWIKNDHSTWTGCVMDRDQDYDVGVTTPSSSGTNFYAENSTTCYYSSTVSLAPVTPLTDIRTSSGWTTLNDAVDAMQANGNTNQTIGIIHGIQTLMSGDPYNAGTLPPYTSKVLIILSDGLNTQNRWSSSANSINDREKLACQAAKDQGAVIYTLFVDLNNAQGDSTPLKNCATDTSHYFDLTSADQIDAAFKTIGTQITQLRVAQ